MTRFNLVKIVVKSLMVLTTVLVFYFLVIGTGKETITVKEVTMTVMYGKPHMILETSTGEFFMIANTYSYVNYKAGKSYKVKTSVGSPYRSIIGGEEVK